MLLALRNDPDAVSLSVTGRAVTAEEHERWFRRVRDDPAHHRLWIAEQDSEPVGQMRVDIAGDTGTVSITVHSDHRRHGLGTAMLRAMVVRVAVEGVPSRLTAVVRADNTASLRAFTAADFRQVAGGAVFLELEWP
jgi:L-amino acid N-acyltransferase YncA